MPEGVSAPAGASATLPAAGADAVAAPPVVAPAAPTEIIMVSDRVVACDGGNGPLGHPRVYLRIVHDSVVCPYCSRLYVLAPGGGQDDGH